MERRCCAPSPARGADRDEPGGARGAGAAVPARAEGWTAPCGDERGGGGRGSDPRPGGRTEGRFARPSAGGGGADRRTPRRRTRRATGPRAPGRCVAAATRRALPASRATRRFTASMAALRRTSAMRIGLHRDAVDGDVPLVARRETRTCRDGHRGRHLVLALQGGLHGAGERARAVGRPRSLGRSDARRADAPGARVALRPPGSSPEKHREEPGPPATAVAPRRLARAGGRAPPAPSAGGCDDVTRHGFTGVGGRGAHLDEVAALATLDHAHRLLAGDLLVGDLVLGLALLAEKLHAVQVLGNDPR